MEGVARLMYVVVCCQNINNDAERTCLRYLVIYERERSDLIFNSSLGLSIVLHSGPLRYIRNVLKSVQRVVLVKKG